MIGKPVGCIQVARDADEDGFNGVQLVGLRCGVLWIKPKRGKSEY